VKGQKGFPYKIIITPERGRRLEEGESYISPACPSTRERKTVRRGFRTTVANSGDGPPNKRWFCGRQ